MSTSISQSIHPPTIIDLNRLTREFGSRVNRLRIDVGSEGILLSGFANSFFVKQLVQERVMQYSSLPVSANMIEVRKR